MELRKFGSYRTDSGLVVTILKRYSITSQKTGEVTDHCFFFYPDAIGVKTKDAITCREENLKDIIVEEVNDEKYAIKAIFNDCDMQKIMDSGQCFRISQIAPCKYIVLSIDKACICTQVGKNVLVNCKDEDTAYWIKYFRQNVEDPQLMGIYDKGIISFDVRIGMGNDIRNVWLTEYRGNRNGIKLKGFDTLPLYRFFYRLKERGYIC